MRILVDGQEATIKSGSSFDYVAENRLFRGRDGYTFEISFPLAGCPENIRIFGQAQRADVPLRTLKYDCEIRTATLSLYGLLLVVGRNQVEIKCQFAEGRCKSNATDPFEDVYVNELDLGKPKYKYAREVTPVDTWKPMYSGSEAVALPWINESFPTVPNNWVTYVGGEYSWHKDVEYLSWQPYLYVIACKICEVIGYSYNFQEWYESQYAHLIICNVLPGSWEMTDYANVLPAWTVSEFFEKLELLMMCEFDFDHKEKTVTMVFSQNVIDNTPVEYINDLVDSYDAQIETEDNVSCDYIGAKRLAYKQTGHAMENYYMCDWYVADMNMPYDYETVEEMLERNKARQGTYGPVYGEKISGSMSFWSDKTSLSLPWRVKAVNTLFCTRSIGTVRRTLDFRADLYFQKRVCTPLNVFGSGIPESDDIDTEEIEFVPVCITDTYISETDDMGYMMMLSFNSEDEAEETPVPADYMEIGFNDDRIVQRGPARIIVRGKEEGKTSAYYDTVFVAFWDGRLPAYGRQPYPIIDSVTITEAWTYVDTGYSLRLHSDRRNIHRQLPQINPTQRYKFSFLSDRIPNPRAIYNIKGQLYLCEKITAVFDENGMSKLLKGEFYPIV